MRLNIIETQREHNPKKALHNASIGKMKRSELSQIQRRLVKLAPCQMLSLKRVVVKHLTGELYVVAASWSEHTSKIYLNQ